MPSYNVFGDDENILWAWGRRPEGRLEMEEGQSPSVSEMLWGPEEGASNSVQGKEDGGTL